MIREEIEKTLLESSWLIFSLSCWKRKTHRGMIKKLEG
jgi:hypothetical protein